jgi:hypothetical protein
MLGSRLQGALAISGMLLGGGFTPAAASPPSVSAARPATPSGLVLTIDPATGRWGPPAGGDLVRRLAAGRRAALSPEVKVAPDGTLSLELGGRFRQAVVARVGADGALSWSCSQAAAAPLPFLTPSAAPVPSVSSVSSALSGELR